MTRLKLEDVRMPDYTRGEEIFNSVSHIVGGALGIVAFVLCIVVASWHHNVYGIVSGAIFGTTMIMLYCMSSIYHGLSPKLKAKKVFRILDHCAVFVLIAGTYSPFCLCTLREVNPTLGWAQFAFVWGLAAFGITLNAINLDKFGKISMILYLGMGWCIVTAFNIIIPALMGPGFWLLLGGGISYTAGTIFFGIGINKRYMHSVFHLFILAGSVMHFLCILLYVM